MPIHTACSTFPSSTYFERTVLCPAAAVRVDHTVVYVLQLCALVPMMPRRGRAGRRLEELKHLPQGTTHHLLRDREHQVFGRWCERAAPPAGSSSGTGSNVVPALVLHSLEHGSEGLAVELVTVLMSVHAFFLIGRLCCCTDNPGGLSSPRAGAGVGVGAMVSLFPLAPPQSSSFLMLRPAMVTSTVTAGASSRHVAAVKRCLCVRHVH